MHDSTRREFAFAFGGALALLSIPLASACRTANPGARLKDDTSTSTGVVDPAAFMALSSALTGFDGLDAATGQALLAELSAHHGEAAAALVSTFKGLDPATNLEEQIATKIMDDATLGPIAVAVIGLWYVGTFTKTTVAEPMAVKTYKTNLAWKLVTKGKPQGEPDEEIGIWSQPLAD